MKVKFRTNLGSRDAVSLGLDQTQCVWGAELTVSGPQGESLADMGVVEVIEAEKPPEPPAPVAPVIKAVPKDPEVSQAKPPAVSGGSDKPKSTKSDK